MLVLWLQASSLVYPISVSALPVIVRYRLQSLLSLPGWFLFRQSRFASRAEHLGRRIERVEGIIRYTTGQLQAPTYTGRGN